MQNRDDAGQALAPKHGVQPEVANCCVSHAVWRNPDVSFEERTVALADKLCNGKRDTDLEMVVIDGAAIRLGVGRWHVFARLDLAFEGIAASADERLRRSLTLRVLQSKGSQTPTCSAVCALGRKRA